MSAPVDASGSSNAAALRIGIVDADRRVRKSLSDVLRLAGMAVVGAAADVREAVDMIARSDPNLLIVDPRLPDVSDGLSMLVSLQDNRPHLRLVLIGWRDGLGSETGLASAAHVSKSAAPDEFVRAILSACEPETPS
jgi:DNA-binding NarL/FixJ family response regulator